MSALTLRPYQTAAIEAVYDFLRTQEGNPLVVLPVGAGKSIVIAQIVKDAVQRWNGRVVVVTHSAELVEQNAQKIKRLCPDLKIGVFCAGLREKTTDTPVVCGSIQSLYRQAGELGSRDLIIVDEAHAIPPDGEGMYRQFLTDAQIVTPHVRTIGMTATPYRTSHGVIFGPDQLFSDVCYEAGLKELIVEGYLSPLISKKGIARVDASQLSVRSGEFVVEEVEDLMDQDSLVRASCAEIVEYTRDRQACLIFASGVKHARHIVEVFREDHDLECGFLCANTPATERAELLTRFKGESTNQLFELSPLKYLVNYGILTTGFDCGRLDAIAVLRPTMSPGLLVQMAGRGTRLCEGKRDCLFLDYGSNLERHGPIDLINSKIIPSRKTKGTGEAPVKECPKCQSVIAAGYAVCPDCGFVFPPPDRNQHEAKASEEGVLSGEVNDEEHEVLDIQYFVHTKRDAKPDDPRTMRVEYRLGLDYWVNEWVCLEHTGYARRKAEKWWRDRSPDPIPATAEQAVDIANAGGVAYAEKITVRTITGEPFPRILRCQLSEKPEAIVSSSLDLEEVPF